MTITGTDLASATAVMFGTAGATITSNTGTQIVATSPAGTAGTVNVTVMTAGGTSAVVLADQFSYMAGPAVTAISPSSSPMFYAIAVIITGTNLADATAVMFGTMYSTIISNTATQVVAITPPPRPARSTSRW